MEHNVKEKWSITGAAVQGRSHIKSGIVCQDKIYYLEKNGIFSMVLCDGAGSARYSQVSAEAVSKLVAENFIINFDKYYENENANDVKNILLNSILELLGEISEENKYDIKDLACTLLAVAIKNEKKLVLHLGDGVIGYVKNNKLNVLSSPENSEFANMTVFVTSENAVNKIKLYKVFDDEIENFVMMSDGAGDSLYSKNENKLANILYKWFNFNSIYKNSIMNEKLNFVFEKVIKEKTFDDCSIILASRRKNALENTELNIKNRYLVKILNELNKKDEMSLKELTNKIKLSNKRINQKKTLKKMIFEFRLKKKLELYLNILVKKGYISKFKNNYKLLIEI